MKQELKFNTNIKCMGCVSQVTQSLNETVGEGNWAVDIQSPEKILTVKSKHPDRETVVAAVAEAGFKAVPVQ